MERLSCMGKPLSAIVWQTVLIELREMFWLVSVIAGLSALGVGLATGAEGLTTIDVDELTTV
jgi:hypothetical protein